MEEVMPAGENIDSNNSFGEQNPWKKMASEMPPFSERNRAEVTSDEDSEYIDIDKIDISTDEGKSEWLDSLFSNAIAKAQEDLSQATLLDDEEQITDATDRLRHAENQQKILNNLFDNTSDGSILDRLGKNYEKHRQFAADLPIEATDEAKQIADERLQAASDLLSILKSEMARRDPNYFRETEMQAMLTAQVDQAEKAVEDSMVTIDSYFGEDGSVHKNPDGGEKRPTAATEDAEINLREAKQDAETFAMLMQIYNVSANDRTSSVIGKADFAPTIKGFIEGHTVQINQLMEAARTLARDTPEYADNTEMRKKLARERSSAARLSERYFSIPDTYSDIDDGMVMEEMPAGKTPEQIEAEKAARKRKEDAEFKRRMQEYTEQRDAEQKQREQNERATREREQKEAERHERIKAAQEKVRQTYQQQEQENEQAEMEM